MDQESESCLDSGFYFDFSERWRRDAAAIVRTVANVIRPPDHFFGSNATAASFTPADLRFAWVGVMAGIAGVGALLLLGLGGIEVDPVSATKLRGGAFSLATAPLV